MSTSKVMSMQEIAQKVPVCTCENYGLRKTDRYLFLEDAAFECCLVRTSIIFDYRIMTLFDHDGVAADSGPFTVATTPHNESDPRPNGPLYLRCM